jgi:hypothetical protein
MGDYKEVNEGMDIISERVELVEIEKTTRGLKWRFRIIGFVDEDLIKRADKIKDRLNEVCTIEDVKSKIEKIKKENLEE